MPDGSEARDTFYVTTPIYYVNDRPHLGHVYTTTIADVVARYHRLRGDDTFFLTGVDEHAAKVADKAAEMGVTPQEWADENAAAFRDVFSRLEMTNDDFVRTSDDRHKEKVTGYVRALIDSGDVYEGEYEGWYDAGQEEYVPEGKAAETDYKSAVSGKPLVRKKEKNYFFKLSAYSGPLLEHFERNPGFVQPDARRKEIVNRLADALDVPISRTGSRNWGIPVPGDPEQTIYVWIDALFNYLSYTDTGERRHYWRTGAVHFIAKDILWFHAAIWPGMLMALQKVEGYDWVRLPRQIYCHSYWVSESGEKMSKSLGNFLDPETLDKLVSDFGLDALRYFLATRGPLGVSDSAFSADLFAEVYNSELANTFGNSCSRITNMVSRYFDGELPDRGTSEPRFSPVVERAAASYVEAMKTHQLGRAVAEGPLTLVREVDAFVDETQPFKLAKDPARLPEVGTILSDCAEALRVASVLLWPFIPKACELFWKRIGCGRYSEALASRAGDLTSWCRWGQLEPGTPIEKGDPLFPRWQGVRS